MHTQDFVDSPHPFLNGLCAAHLRILAEAATQTHFAAGSHIFREGELANRFYLIESGKVALQTHSGGHPVAIQTLGAGDVLGWSWLFPPYFWHYDAFVQENTSVVRFDAIRLREECEADKALGYEVMKRVAEVLIHRLQATRLKFVQSHKQERDIAPPTGA